MSGAKSFRLPAESLALLGLAALLAGSPAAEAAPGAATPLLDYASGLRFPSMAHEAQYRAQLAASLHELRAAPPPAEDCARSLGASRFATTLGALAEAQGGLGRHAEALETYEKALGCAPRDLELLASRAAELYYAGQRAEASEAADRALAIDPGHYRLNALRAQLDFAAERWAQAAESFVRLARRTREGDLGTYWAMLAWIAERHAGVSEPQLAVTSNAADWPGPLMQLLRGELGEAALLARIEAEPLEMRRRELLAEALYYAGQDRLLTGDRDAARRYIAASVNLKVLHFVEHHLALAALAQLREDD